jgi:large subunit ribosomal protein L32e
MKFLRQETWRFKRLGSHKKKLATWRRPRGKHSKMRLKRTGYPVQPGIGFGTPRKHSGRVKGLIPVRVSNVNEVSLMQKGQIAIIARVGAKKKLDIIKKAESMGIPLSNVRGKK